jgi:hypothetical protein
VDAATGIEIVTSTLQKGFEMEHTEQQKKYKDAVLAEAAKGNIVFVTMDGAVIANLEDFVTQPAEGILYDLNRSREVVLMFIDDPKWTNDYAVALVIDKLKTNLAASQNRTKELEDAIRKHRSQKADDRCIEDDDELYAALGDGIKCDRRVGDKMAMLENCARFIERHCEGGGWPTYQALESQITNALGIPIGVNDSNGNPIRTGDTLRFDKQIWYRDSVIVSNQPLSTFPEMDFEIRLEKGELRQPGVTSDLKNYCTIIRKWNEQ